MTPPIIGSKRAEREAIMEAAKLMMIAARTAPKASGIDDILTLIVHGKEKDAIAEKMLKTAEEREIDGFKRDAKNVKDSDAIVLVGIRGKKSLGLNCGACGHETCDKFSESKIEGRDFKGPTCMLKALDLGIALGSAVKTAGILNVDNRIMYRVGTTALKLGLMPEATIIMGIPVSAKGKSIYFDRAK